MNAFVLFHWAPFLCVFDFQTKRWATLPKRRGHQKNQKLYARAFSKLFMCSQENCFDLAGVNNRHGKTRLTSRICHVQSTSLRKHGSIHLLRKWSGIFPKSLRTQSSMLQSPSTKDLNQPIVVRIPHLQIYPHSLSPQNPATVLSRPDVQNGPRNTGASANHDRVERPCMHVLRTRTATLRT